MAQNQQTKDTQDILRYVNSFQKTYVNTFFLDLLLQYQKLRQSLNEERTATKELIKRMEENAKKIAEMSPDEQGNLTTQGTMAVSRHLELIDRVLEDKTGRFTNEEKYRFAMAAQNALNSAMSHEDYDKFRVFYEAMQETGVYTEAEVKEVIQNLTADYYGQTAKQERFTLQVVPIDLENGEHLAADAVAKARKYGIPCEALFAPKTGRSAICIFSPDKDAVRTVMAIALKSRMMRSICNIRSLDSLQAVADMNKQMIFKMDGLTAEEAEAVRTSLTDRGRGAKPFHMQKQDDGTYSLYCLESDVNYLKNSILRSLVQVHGVAQDFGVKDYYMFAGSQREAMYDFIDKLTSEEKPDATVAYLIDIDAANRSSQSHMLAVYEDRFVEITNGESREVRYSDYPSVYEDMLREKIDNFSKRSYFMSQEEAGKHGLSSVNYTLTADVIKSIPTPVIPKDIRAELQAESAFMKAMITQVLRSNPDMSMTECLDNLTNPSKVERLVSSYRIDAKQSLLQSEKAIANAIQKRLQADNPGLSQKELEMQARNEARTYMQTRLDAIGRIKTIDQVFLDYRFAEEDKIANYNISSKSLQIKKAGIRAGIDALYGKDKGETLNARLNALATHLSSKMMTFEMEKSSVIDTLIEQEDIGTQKTMERLNAAIENQDQTISAFEKNRDEATLESTVRDTSGMKDINLEGYKVRTHYIGRAMKEEHPEFQKLPDREIMQMAGRAAMREDVMQKVLYSAETQIPGSERAYNILNDAVQQMEWNTEGKDIAALTNRELRDHLAEIDALSFRILGMNPNMYHESTIDKLQTADEREAHTADTRDDRADRSNDNAQEL